MYNKKRKGGGGGGGGRGERQVFLGEEVAAHLHLANFTPAGHVVMYYIVACVYYDEVFSPVNCSDPTPPVDGSIFQNTAEIFFRCNSMFVSPTRMTATCASSGMWTPDPGSLTCLANYF